MFYNGIDWTNDLNSNIRVTLNDSALIHEFFKNNSYVSITYISLIEDRIYGIKPDKYLPDKDFCIYAKFPFNQMVIVKFYNFDVDIQKMPCTLVWLIHNKQFLIELISIYSKIPKTPYPLYRNLDVENFTRIFNKCDFYKR